MVENGKISSQRVIQKLDELLSRNDYSSAKAHLLYWLKEANGIGDLKNALLLIMSLWGFAESFCKKRRLSHLPKMHSVL